MNIYLLLDTASFTDDFCLLKLQCGNPTLLLRKEGLSHLIIDSHLNKPELVKPRFFNLRAHKLLIEKVLNISQMLNNGKLAILSIIAIFYPQHQSIDMFDLFRKLIYQNSKLSQNHANHLLRKHRGVPLGTLEDQLSGTAIPRPKSAGDTNLQLQSYLYKMGADIYTLKDI